MVSITRNLWSPDTCACQIEYEFDADVDGLTRTHTYVRTVRTCAAHSGLASLSTHLDTVLDRNRRKNLTYAQLLTVLATVTPEQFAGLWSYDAAQNLLTVNGTAAGLTAAQRNNLQTKCNTQFGSGRVTVI